MNNPIRTKPDLKTVSLNPPVIIAHHYPVTTQTSAFITRLIGIELDLNERRHAEEALHARRDEERDHALQKQAEEALRRSHAELQQRTLQLRRLASDLTLAEHHAREELAKTLHDGLQQLLFSAAMTLDRSVSSTSQAGLVTLLQRARADRNEATTGQQKSCDGR